MSSETLHSVRLKVSGEMIPISRRLVAPEKFSYRVEHHESFDMPARVLLECRWGTSTRKYQIERLTLEPHEGGEQLTSHLLRKVQVGNLLEAATRSHLILHARVITPEGTRSTTKAMDEFEGIAERLKQEGPSSLETLEWVALIYEIASTEGSKPTQAVSGYFGINIRTASNWVRAARESGVLEGG